MQVRHFILILALLPASLWAQARPAAPQKVARNSNRITEIVASGSTRFQPAALISSMGLKIGEDGTEEKFQAAASALAASGMFTDITYSWESAPQGMRVEYKVQDVAQLYPPQFDNFVWLTRDELLSALKKRRPLFRGEIPNAGEMYIQLGEDMQAILAEMHVNATVKARPVTAMEGGRIIGFRYTVEGVRIPIRAVDFPGAAPEMVAILKEVAASKIGSDFSETVLLTFSRLDLLPQYMSRGYLQARFGALEFTPADAATNSVAVRLPVREGLCYRLKEVQWSGNSAFPGQELAKLLKVKIGTTANSVQLDEDLGAISRNYGTRGYMRPRLKANPTFNDEEKTVSFRIDVTEGDQYRMGVMRMEGASEAVTEKGAELWKLRAGDVYDSSYAQQFLKDLFQEFDLRAFRISIGQPLNQEKKTVDVVLRFMGH